MASDVRITMLGYTGTGKTAYLVGVYGHSQIVALQGFTLRSVNQSDGQRMLDRWAALEQGGDDRWPPATSGFEDHQFVLDYAMVPVVTVDWDDYSGGTIDANTLVSPPDYQKLMARLVESTCVFLTVSGEFLKEPLRTREAMDRLKVHKMNELMGQLVRKVRPTRDKPLPVAIVITKNDYCRGRADEDVDREIMTLFNPLFATGTRLLFRGPSYLTAICRVTLGNDLAKNRDTGLLAPDGTEQPILFAAWAKLRQNIKDATSSGVATDEVTEMKGKLALLSDQLDMPIYLDGQSLTSPTS
jgi:hypothetical protein